MKFWGWRGQKFRGEKKTFLITRKFFRKISSPKIGRSYHSVVDNESGDNGRKLVAREEKKGRPLPEAYTWVNLGCNFLSLARAVLRMVGARQGSSLHGRSTAVAAGGLVSSQTYKDLVECADDTAENKNQESFFLMT